jgi:3-carboxy-cis,cis-muconate cycloisomerase
VHFGATTQDVLDTAMALCLKPCLEEADRCLEGAIRALARRALEHRATPMLGRTLMQPAVAMSAGVKIARWACALAATASAWARRRPRASRCSAAGRSAPSRAWAPRGSSCGATWRAGSRSPTRRRGRRTATPGSDLLDRVGLAVLTAGKIARDVSLLMQPEVGEMRESPPQDGVGARARCRTSATPWACVHGAGRRDADGRAPRSAARLGPFGARAALGGWQAELALVPTSCPRSEAPSISWTRSAPRSWSTPRA